MEILEALFGWGFIILIGRAGYVLLKKRRKKKEIDKRRSKIRIAPILSPLPMLEVHVLDYEALDRSIADMAPPPESWRAR